MYMNRANDDIFSQNTVYRYLTQSGYDSSLRFGSVRGYATTEYSESIDEVMSREQITKQ